jgi:dihydroneopterin aldolase
VAAVWWDRERSHECVALRDVEIEVRIGVGEAEMAGPQPVRVDVELYRRRGAFAEAEHGFLDYHRVHRHLVEDWPARPHEGLLEAWAEELVGFCLADRRVEACRVVVRKPAIYGGRGVPSVEVYRRREG